MPDHARVIPALTYQDIPAAHDFLVDAFGFQGGGVSSDAEGTPFHGEVSTGDAIIWLHRVTAEHRLDQPYGQREYGARDSEGHRWWFATPTTSEARG